MHLDLPPPTLVQDARGFERLMQHLDRADEVAVDTEADSFFSYREKVCLIQVTVDEQDFLLDPLARIDITAFGRALADPRKLKVFHDGEYDILILKRDFRFEFKNLFDTRVAAATLGSQAPGLASVLKQHFDIELDKSMQRSNWSLRPLTDKQIRYARLDTHFLLPLMRRQREDLAARRRAEVVEGECLRLEQLEPPKSSFDPDEFARIKGARTLAPIERQVMRELFVLREKLAEADDQPPFRIMNNETLIEMARQRPRHNAELAQVKGFSSKQVRKMGDQVLAAIARGNELGPMRSFPQLPSKDGTGALSEEEVELHERLKQWRKTVGEEMGMDSAYVLNRHVVMRITKQQPRSLEEVERIEGIRSWQVREFGEEILAVVRQFADDVRSGAWEPRRRRVPRGDG